MEKMYGVRKKAYTSGYRMIEDRGENTDRQTLQTVKSRGAR